MARRQLRAFATLVAVATGSSACTLKYSHHRLDDGWFDDRLERSWLPPLELGFMTGDVALGFSALALSFEAAKQPLHRDAVPPLVEFESVDLSSYVLAARLFPLARGPLRPYAGAGYGVSRLRGAWTGPNYAVDQYDCFGECEGTYDETFYSSYHPHLIAGLEMRPVATSRLSYLIEYRKDFDRGDDFYDLGGDRFSAGLRWRASAN